MFIIILIDTAGFDIYFGRFDGAAAEPQKGIRSGHVPGSKCIPFAQVKDPFYDNQTKHMSFQKLALRLNSPALLLDALVLI